MTPVVSIIMGSTSDLPVMEKAGYHRPLYPGDQSHLQAAGKAGPWVFLHHRRGEEPGRAGGAVPK